MKQTKQKKIQTTDFELENLFKELFPDEKIRLEEIKAAKRAKNFFDKLNGTNDDYFNLND